jgi:hypothetical protein
MATDSSIQALNGTLARILAEITKLREAAERIAASHPEKK